MIAFHSQSLHLQHNSFVEGNQVEQTFSGLEIGMNPKALQSNGENDDAWGFK
jgi:hypothetical protein